MKNFLTLKWLPRVSPFWKGCYLAIGAVDLIVALSDLFTGSGSGIDIFFLVCGTLFIALGWPGEEE